MGMGEMEAKLALMRRLKIRFIAYSCGHLILCLIALDGIINNSVEMRFFGLLFFVAFGPAGFLIQTYFDILKHIKKPSL